MPRSLLDQDVSTVLLQAQTAQTRQVTVDGRAVDVLKPFASPADWRDRWIYLLMIDRFNNPAAPPASLPFDRAFGGFQGGTLTGIREQLGYIKNLGAGAIWITPPFQNKQRLNGASNEGTYHGYGIQHFLAIDPHFGTEQDLIDLVDEAHAREMYVIFDIVINHGGDLFQYVGHGSQAPFQSGPYEIEWRDGNGNPRTEWRIAPDQIIGHPDFNDDSAVLPLELLDNRYWRRQGSNLEGIEGDFVSLKQLRTDFSQTTPEWGFEYTVRNTLIAIYQYIVAKFDVDGFHITALRHVERPFARVFGNAMREFAASIGKKNFFISGEVLAISDEELARYTERFASDADDFVGVDAILDFPLFFTLPGVIKGQPGNPPINLANLYEHRKNVLRGGEASRFFLLFLDNHFQHNRFRFVDPTNPNRFDDQLTMAVGCLFGLQGIPVLYYGTEQGLHGAGNSDQIVREALWGIVVDRSSLARIVNSFANSGFDPDVIRNIVTQQLTSTDARRFGEKVAMTASSDVLRDFQEYFRTGVENTLHRRAKK